MTIVEHTFDDGQKMVGYHRGQQTHNGVTYQIVSPFSDDRPAHWLPANAFLRVVGESQW